MQGRKTYTFVFDLGEVKYDIKIIKFMNVYINGNRDFGAESVKISVARTAEKAGNVENTHTYESEVQYNTNCFNYIYDLSTEAAGRYVYIEIYSLNYVVSLSEIEIWSKPQYNSSLVIPDEIDPNPKFDIVLSSKGSFTVTVLLNFFVL